MINHTFRKFEQQIILFNCQHICLTLFLQGSKLLIINLVDEISVRVFSTTKLGQKNWVVFWKENGTFGVVATCFIKHNQAFFKGSAICERTYDMNNEH